MNICSHNSTFPSDVIKWMKLNASPRISLKLMQICNYFQHPKFPYFVIKNLHGDDYGWQYQAVAVQSGYEKINLEALPDKLWITGDLNLLIKPYYFPLLMSKIEVFDVQKMYFIDQEITFEHFKTLTCGGNVVTLSLNKTFIIYENGEPVTLENIFECLPNVKRILFLTLAIHFCLLKLLQ